MSTTKIDDLPEQNISLEKKEVAQQPLQESSPVAHQLQAQSTTLNPPMASADSIQTVVTALQNNPTMGKLPSRDIPMQTGQLTQDQAVKPDYLPNQNMGPDYIKEYENFVSLANKHKENEAKNDRLDEIFDMLKLPVLAGVLFFVFQLPFVNKLLKSKFKSLFDGDGLPTNTLFIVKSLLFSSSFFASKKFLLDEKN